jgi:diguanylate cyclase (GGDEF)-like protein/PAS domain S-box-containing protein
VAERLTGWSLEQAAGRPSEEVLNVIDAVSRGRAQNPIALAIRENKTVGLTPNCILVRRDGFEAAIEDSAAPIHDRYGQVTGAVMVFHDVTSARALTQRMAYLAQHDGLTDLPNRILLNDRLAQALAIAKRGHLQLAVLYLDMDRFKNINDSMGHATGDRVLQSVANRLLSCVRGSDTVSRQGGDEFVILLSQIGSAQDAAICADKIICALAAPLNIGEAVLHVTVSVGIVTYPGDGSTAESLLQNADFAMYQAKNGGRNCYQFFASEMNLAALERQSTESALRLAIERQEFVLHYQPKLNLETGAITAVEALVRWNNPLRGMVHPAQFIPIAEESGLIVPIGRWILREGCVQAKAWQNAGLAAIRIAINVSAAELRSKGFVAGVREVLQETGLEPRYLELELTETFLMQDSKSTVTVLQALKSVGVQIALDDFGTGYSSLSYMKRFPVDTLKIDESFIRCLTSDPVDAGIVGAVIMMGKSLHKRVVAEGIETAEQLAFLRRQGCPEGQGYYLARPMSALDLGRLLQNERTPKAWRAAV